VICPSILTATVKGPLMASTFRIASFNVENLFERPKAMRLSTWEEGRPILEQHARINQLLNQPHYSAGDKTEILELLTKLGLNGSDEGGPFVRLRQIRERLVKRPPGKPVEIVASGRADWIGWVDLKTEPVDELAMRHTARVIKDIDAEILGVIEAENRISLGKFSAQMLQLIGGTPYPRVMLIDGNDDRGIDVALLTKAGFEIASVKPHVDDADGQGLIFSRDCPEYSITTPTGETIVVLVNHLKSKGFGSQASSNAKRRRQAKRTAEIYARLVAEGHTSVAVVGDFNDTPGSAALAPLLGQTDLLDVSTHPKFVSDGRPGTFGNGTKGTKIDYILLSPALFGRVTNARIFRKGVWGGKNGVLWPIYPTMKEKVHQASDHAAIYADIKL
jgi:endonuclease/exonuclease/phosphatase family metal-dependent hydrolase